MKLLLDTHAFLWFVMGSANLSAKARATIEVVKQYQSLSLATLTLEEYAPVLLSAETSACKPLS